MLPILDLDRRVPVPNFERRVPVPNLEQRVPVSNVERCVPVPNVERHVPVPNLERRVIGNVIGRGQRDAIKEALSSLKSFHMYEKELESFNKWLKNEVCLLNLL